MPDEAAGGWGGEAVSGLIDIVNGLKEEYAEDRMPLPEVLARLSAMTAVSGSGGPVAATEELGEARMCIICEEAPREVRFACGHATVCAACLPGVVTQHRECPTCSVAFGAEPVADRGEHVRVAPTFVMPSRAPQ